MYGIEHILSPLSAGWPAWVMLALLLCVVLAEFSQPGLVTQAHTSLTAQSDRMYKEAPDNLFGQTLIALFRIGTPSLGLYMCLPGAGPFSLKTYLALCGVLLGTVLVKMALHQVLSYTFRLRNRVSASYEHYGNLATLTVLALYPAILILLRLGDTEATLWTLGIAAAFFVGMWVYRSARILIAGPADILYYALYIGTLEVLPIAGVYFAAKKLIMTL